MAAPKEIKAAHSTHSRPILKNTSFAEVEHFRQQVELINLIGCEDLTRVAEQVEKCAAQNLPQFSGFAIISIGFGHGWIRQKEKRCASDCVCFPDSVLPKP
ncbi:MAG TPA: hypothetical protein VGA99_06120 [bacterium]